MELRAEKGARRHRIEGRNFLRTYAIHIGAQIRSEFATHSEMRPKKISIPRSLSPLLTPFLGPKFPSPKELAMELRAEKGERRYRIDGRNFVRIYANQSARKIRPEFA